MDTIPPFGAATHCGANSTVSRRIDPRRFRLSQQDDSELHKLHLLHKTASKLAVLWFPDPASQGQIAHWGQQSCLRPCCEPQNRTPHRFRDHAWYLACASASLTAKRALFRTDMLFGHYNGTGKTPLSLGARNARIMWQLQSLPKSLAGSVRWNKASRTRFSS